MANEIAIAYDSAKTLYAFVYRQSDKYIYDVGDTAFEAIGTWNDARADECDIAMTASGDMHFANFPVVAAGTYFVQIREQAGASPDTDDIPVGQGFMEWDGTAEITLSVLDTAVDYLITSEGKVNNVVEQKEVDISETKSRIYL